MELHSRWEPGFNHRWFWFGDPVLRLDQVKWAICCLLNYGEVLLVPGWDYAKLPDGSEFFSLARNCDQAQPVVDWLLEFAPPEFADRLGSLIGKGVGL